MIIKRVYNNNVAMACAEDGGEVIVIGRGLCFSRHAGDAIDESLVEKTFTLQDQSNLGKLEKLIQQIDPLYITIAEDIVEMLRRESDLDFDDTLLIALADHISLSIEREREGIPCENPLLVEIKQLYGTEFSYARRAAGIIKEATGVTIGEGEMGFITLHIVNATMRQRADKLIASMEMIQGATNIVADAYDGTIGQDSAAYQRFLRHIQFFSQRVLGEDAQGQSEDDLPVLLASEDYPKAFDCAQRISDYVEGTFGIHVTAAERSYLVYHLANLFGTEGRGAS